MTYDLKGGEEIRDGVLYGWTGQKCPACKGHGERYDAGYGCDKACPDCGGTGEQWGVMPAQPDGLGGDESLFLEVTVYNNDGSVASYDKVAVPDTDGPSEEDFADVHGMINSGMRSCDAMAAVKAGPRPVTEYDDEPCPECGDSVGWDGDFCDECGHPHFTDEAPQ